jgi:hypothetical protein
VDVRRNLAKNKDEQYNPDALAPTASVGRPKLSQKKLKELKKAGHPIERLQASFDKCWAGARAHATGRDDKYDTWWKEMLANQGVRIALLKATSMEKKRNTDLAFLIGGNDGQMDEEMRAWYEMPQCQFPVFCCFCVSEKLHRKYSRNWTKRSLNLLFFPTRDEVRRRAGGG